VISVDHEECDRSRLDMRRNPACEQAVEFTAGRNRDELDHDRMLQLALVKLVEVVGEAAKAVGEVTRTRDPDVPRLGGVTSGARSGMFPIRTSACPGSGITGHGQRRPSAPGSAGRPSA
jgi:hypothetical protein